ncbi:ribonuclease HII [candidate division WWE3 bacterium]|nr:ribonuclease HII [candidate division WWE3 bacterium]
MLKSSPLTCDFEKPYWSKNILPIGLDEVGRGALAGPLVVGAVMFNPNIDNSEIFDELADVRDSKKLSHDRRVKVMPLIKKHARFWGIGAVPAQVVDLVGITASLKIATLNAIHKSIQDDIILLTDRGLLQKGLAHLHHQEIMQGDDACFSIAAASIVAKVWRDEYMKRIGSKFPLNIYRWYENVGYASEYHRTMIKLYGPSPFHRQSFIKNILSQ